MKPNGTNSEILFSRLTGVMTITSENCCSKQLVEDLDNVKLQGLGKVIFYFCAYTLFHCHPQCSHICKFVHTIMIMQVTVYDGGTHANSSMFVVLCVRT